MPCVLHDELEQALKALGAEAEINPWDDAPTVWRLVRAGMRVEFVPSQWSNETVISASVGVTMRVLLPCGAPEAVEQEVGGYRDLQHSAAARPELPDMPRIIMHQEGSADRFFKKLRIYRETQVDDEGFDSKVMIRSSEPDEVVRATLADKGTRYSIRKLFAQGALHL